MSVSTAESFGDRRRSQNENSEEKKATHASKEDSDGAALRRVDCAANNENAPILRGGVAPEDESRNFRIIAVYWIGSPVTRTSSMFQPA